MTASKLVPQEIAARLLDQHPATALDLALEVVRLVSNQQRTAERLRVAVHNSIQGDAANEIVRAVCFHFALCERELRSRGKCGVLARARYVAWVLLQQRLGWSHGQIGRFFGREVSTVWAGFQIVKADDADVVKIGRRLDSEVASEAAE